VGSSFANISTIPGKAKTVFKVKPTNVPKKEKDTPSKSSSLTQYFNSFKKPKKSPTEDIENSSNGIPPVNSEDASQEDSQESENVQAEDSVDSDSADEEGSSEKTDAVENPSPTDKNVVKDSSALGKEVNGVISSDQSARDKNGVLAGKSVAIMQVHLEGNVGDQMETLPLLMKLNSWGVVVDCYVSTIAKAHKRVDPQVLERVLPYTRQIFTEGLGFDLDIRARKYDVIIVAPGMPVHELSHCITAVKGEPKNISMVWFGAAVSPRTAVFYEKQKYWYLNLKIYYLFLYCYVFHSTFVFVYH
jgi:hypothetical protein